MRPKYFETFARKIIAKKNGSCSLGNTLLISTEIKQQIWNQHHWHKSQVKFCQDQKVNTFWAKMSKFGDLCLKFLKTIFRFEISTFEIEYSQNFIKNRKLILFGPNAHIWRFELHTFQNEYRIWNQHFRMVFEKSAPQLYMRNFASIRKLLLFCPKYQNFRIWAWNFKK